MSSFGEIDPLALGHRVRHHRRRLGLTLADLSARVGRPVPYLSQVENARVEVRLSTVSDLARALGCASADLLDPAPPSLRAALEIELERAQRSDRFARLGLAPLRITRQIPDDVLGHLVELLRATDARDRARDAGEATSAGAVTRAVNVEIRRELRARGNYLPELEKVARRLLRAAGYLGHGPLSEGALAGLAAHLGLRVVRAPALPASARSITDTEAHVIYIRQRDDVPIRAARSATVQALAHFALGHEDAPDAGTFLRQRVEANYLAAALLCPEAPAVRLLKQLHVANELSVEDLKEAFYLSYEMAAHRFANLATRHLDMPVHFLRTNADGIIGKAYENDGLPLPQGADGSIEGQRVPLHWGARRAWTSPLPVHLQHTRHAVGEFFCATYVETEGERTPHSISLGTTAIHAPRFRGSVGAEHEDARRPPRRRARSRHYTVVSARHSSALSAPTPESRPFAPLADIDLDAVEDFLHDMRSTRPRRSL